MRVHPVGRGREPALFKAKTSRRSKWLTGVEIDAAAEEALLDAFADGEGSSVDTDVLRRVRLLRPGSEAKRKEIRQRN